MATHVRNTKEGLTIQMDDNMYELKDVRKIRKPDTKYTKKIYPGLRLLYSTITLSSPILNYVSSWTSSSSFIFLTIQNK